MSAQRKSEERRQYRRISDAIALQIHQPDETANPPEFGDDLPEHPTHVVSLSPNGLKCYYDRPFSNDDMLHLRIRLFPGGQVLSTRARVVMAGKEDKPNKTNRFFAGLAFVGLADEQKTQLLEHIERVARESFGGAVKLVNR